MINSTKIVRNNRLKYWQGETCDKCGRDQRVAWAVKDKVWKLVIPKQHRDLVFCLECFFELADIREINISNNSFLYLGVASYNDYKRPVFLNKLNDK